MTGHATNDRGAGLRRWMYGAAFVDFRRASEVAILGELLAHAGVVDQASQTNAWREEIGLLRALDGVVGDDARLYLEYTVPRMGSRADALLLVRQVLFVLEFKVGATEFTSAAYDQVWDYALDLKNFHEGSHHVAIVPVLVATGAPTRPVALRDAERGDRLAAPVCVAGAQIAQVVEAGLQFFADAPPIDADAWEGGRYLPTPTIIEAARALYAGHAVEEISRSDAGARNLAVTSRAIDAIVDGARRGRRKAICFVTGVPGAGKTLVGLDVANRHNDQQSETYGVFLSGNGPLVAVLREALTRDRVERERRRGHKVTKVQAGQGVKAFIQNVHHFRDEYVTDPKAPPEHVVLFDEAQRAWDLAMTEAFMRKKKNLPGFDQSEPQFLISCLDRHADWAVIVCLVGGGQEINTGEAGIGAWLDAVLRHYPHWDVHVSPRLGETEYGAAEMLRRIAALATAHFDPDLHLATSMRSFRAERLSEFVRDVLDLDVSAAGRAFDAIRARYPIVVTRDLARARRWLRDRARGSERYGIVVSSQAERLKPHAIDVRVKTDPVKWFLDGKEDVRSSYYLEDVATEFVVQGLELDWACVVWDGDLRYADGAWSHHEFRGSRWQRIHKPERQRYLQNAYRVLLTRARQGMVVVVPEGDASDPTRLPAIYDPTWAYLRRLGLPELVD